ncbi:MAG: 50S ribosomal protein L22 [Bacteroidota bacterium]|nr:50S ribosomal protein L22 [Bacteroidota bacterium]MDP4231109.1 50S ribosomal protein L22 [Bacteroidota bacterium]MDP4236863.1 50S ribosomal protein L22 [Bacteroidota bacterium]
MAQAVAKKKNIQSSPVKMRLVLDHIRGKKVPEALATLHFMTNKASLVAEQTLRSAIANFQLKDENRGIDVEDLFISQCYSDGGPMLKRIMPAPMGRAFRVRKRSNHLTIFVSDRLPGAKKIVKAETEQKAEAPAPAAAPKKTARKKTTKKSEAAA